MREWLDEFYGSAETRAALEASMAPLFTELGGAAALVAGSEVGVTNPVVASFLQSMVSSYVDRHLNSSRAQLQELLDSPDPRAAIQQRLVEWTEKRPGKVAFEETVRTTNAVTETVYRDAGVTRKKWNARGKSCPYCRRMNGKVVGIDRPFHREGDEIEVPDSEVAAKAKLNFTHDIGHPPQHQGCDCTIEADLDPREFENKVDDLASDEFASNASGSPRTRELALKAGYSEEDADALASLAQGWSMDAMSFDGMALREAALKRGATAGDFATHPQRNLFVGSRFAPVGVPQAENLLSLSQEAVKRELGTTGSIRVYRGLSYSSPLPNGPSAGTTVKMSLEQRPLSSWTTNRSEAFRFAEKAQAESGVGYVLEMDVPVTDVAGLAGTGLGNGAHSEVVLYGRASHVAEVTLVDPAP